MVYIFYYKTVSRLPAELFRFYLEQLPILIKKKVLAFKNWEDAERSLAGNILLKRGLQSLNITGYSLEQLKYTEFRKPYFDKQLNFNISHSGRYTVCAISKTNNVGIDVEEIKELPLIDFTEFFNKDEWAAVLKSTNKLHAFYTLWTKKEAFLKVIGSGLNTPLNTVTVQNNGIIWGDSNWLLQEIQLDPFHICYLCCNAPLPFTKVQKVDL